jgi:hypothetical protein
LYVAKTLCDFSREAFHRATGTSDRQNAGRSATPRTVTEKLGGRKTKLLAQTGNFDLIDLFIDVYTIESIK